MVPAPACITLRPLPTVPASCPAFSSLSSAMPPSSEPSRSGAPVLLSAPGLSVVALVLFVLFVSLVAAVLFPVQLLDPAWQLRLAGTLINTAAFPLLGLALLQIAAELGPHDPQLKNRARLCSQLAVAAALGFLLLLPLQTITGLALALGFAALGQRPGRDLSLLQELQSRMRRSKQGRPARRSGTTDADYLQQLSRGDREP